MAGRKVSVDDPVFKGLKSVEYYYDKGLYKYTWGKTKDLARASDLLEVARKAGFPNAFIVPFYKNQRITLEEAKSIGQN